MCCAAPAMAQIDQGRLVGTVTDAQGGVLPGVTVTAKSPALIGVRTTVTEADGKFSIASIPSGAYELTFELSGFQAFKRPGIILGLGKILTVDGQMQVASLQESVTVTGASPVVDMQSSKVGTDFTTDKLVGVPTATDVWAVLGQASGVRMNGFDVGGSHKSQQTGYESFGIRNQNRVLNDGVDTTEGSGGAGFLRRLLLQRGDGGQRGGRRRRDELAGLGGREHDQERRQHVQDAQQPHLPAGIVRGGQHERAAHRARLHGPAEHQVLGGPHRHRRADQDRQALVLRRLQSLQDRQADLRCRRATSRPTSASSTTS